MEEPSYSTLKCSLSSISAKALNASSRQTLGGLDHQQPLRSPKGYARDYRGLAELMGFQFYEVKRFEEFPDRSTKIYEAWETRTGSTLDKLIGYLEDMDRYDIISDLIPTLEKDVEEYKKSLVEAVVVRDLAENPDHPVQVDEERDVAENQESPVQVDEVSTGIRRRALTRDDVRTGKCTKYDAYLSYDDDDSHEAFKIAQNLESPKVGLKLLIRARDLLAGNFEFETHLELIMNRCRRMLMILTPNFIKNPTLEFQVNFAAKLGVERNDRILIPVVVKPCGIPPVLRDMSKIDLTQRHSQKWLWENLVLSILPEDGVPFSLTLPENDPLNDIAAISNSASEDID